MKLLLTKSPLCGNFREAIRFREWDFAPLIASGIDALSRERGIGFAAVESAMPVAGPGMMHLRRLADLLASIWDGGDT